MRSDREAKEADFEATKAEMTDTRSARLARLSGGVALIPEVIAPWRTTPATKAPRPTLREVPDVRFDLVRLPSIF